MGKTPTAGKTIIRLSNIPTPYRLAFLNELDGLCRENDCRLLCIFDEQTLSHRDWSFQPSDFKFEYHFAKGFHIPVKRVRKDTGMVDQRYFQVRWNLIPMLRRFRPDVLLSGEMGTRTLQAALYCKATGVPLLIGWEGTNHTEAVAGWARKALREFVIKQASGFWSNGQESTANLVRYGAAEGRVLPGMTSVDTTFYANATADQMPQREATRTALGLDGVVFLFVGQFIDRKGTAQYLDALSRLYDRGKRGWSLLFAGSGPLEDDLRRWQAEHPEVPVRIEISVPPKELPRLFAAADVFALPTLDDNWPLAPLEALAAGLPQLASRYSGGTADLVQADCFGRVFDPLDPKDFDEKLQAFVDNPPLRIPQDEVLRVRRFYSSEEQAARAWESFRSFLGEGSNAG